MSKAEKMRDRLANIAKEREEFEQKKKELEADMHIGKQNMGKIKKGMKNNEIIDEPMLFNEHAGGSHGHGYGHSGVGSSGIGGSTHSDKSVGAGSGRKNSKKSDTAGHRRPRSDSQASQGSSASPFTQQNGPSLLTASLNGSAAAGHGNPFSPGGNLSSNGSVNSGAAPMPMPVIIPAGMRISDWCYTAPVDGNSLQSPPVVKSFKDLYETVRHIGRGAFGDVNLIKNLDDNKLFAVKQMFCPKETDLSLCLREVKFIRKARHPCIIDINDCFITSNPRVLHIVMPYCESGNLANVMNTAKRNNSAVPENKLVHWMVQICLAVQFLHEIQILHRDLKPMNIMLAEGGEVVKICDFGLAMNLEDISKMSAEEAGTPYYTSPEMIEGQSYSFPSDNWSIGVILYQMMALSRPFEGNSTAVLVKSILDDQPPPLPTHYSDELRGACLELLNKNAALRITCADLLRDPFFSGKASSFPGSYRPRALEERIRRTHLRQLEHQLESLHLPTQSAKNTARDRDRERDRDRDGSSSHACGQSTLKSRQASRDTMGSRESVNSSMNHLPSMVPPSLADGSRVNSGISVHSAFGDNDSPTPGAAGEENGLSLGLGPVHGSAGKLYSLGLVEEAENEDVSTKIQKNGAFGSAGEHHLSESGSGSARRRSNKLRTSGEGFSRDAIIAIQESTNFEESENGGSTNQLEAAPANCVKVSLSDKPVASPKIAYATGGGAGVGGGNDALIRVSRSFDDYDAAVMMSSRQKGNSSAGIEGTAGESSETRRSSSEGDVDDAAKRHQQQHHHQKQQQEQQQQETPSKAQLELSREENDEEETVTEDQQQVASITERTDVLAMEVDELVGHLHEEAGTTGVESYAQNAAAMEGITDSVKQLFVVSDQLLQDPGSTPRMTLPSETVLASNSSICAADAAAANTDGGAGAGAEKGNGEDGNRSNASEMGDMVGGECKGEGASSGNTGLLAEAEEVKAKGEGEDGADGSAAVGLHLSENPSESSLSPTNPNHAHGGRKGQELARAIESDQFYEAQMSELQHHRER